MNRGHIDTHWAAVRTALELCVLHEQYTLAMSSLATLRALALNAVDRPDWQPIATAPKNAVGLLLWFPPLHERGLAGVGTPGYYSYTLDRWLATSCDVKPPRYGQQPTHWMRLLEGPCSLSK